MGWLSRRRAARGLDGLREETRRAHEALARAVAASGAESSSGRRDAERHYEAALQAVERGRPADEVRAAFEPALERLRAERLALLAGSPEVAQGEHLAEAFALVGELADPDDAVRHHLELAGIALEARREEDLRANLEAALELVSAERRLEPVAGIVGSSHRAERRGIQASWLADVRERALALIPPHDPDERSAAALATVFQAQLQEAGPEVARATAERIRDDAAREDAFHELALLRAREGDAEESLRALDGIEDELRRERWRLDLAEALARGGHEAAARAAAEGLLEEDSRDELERALAESAAERGDVAAALEGLARIRSPRWRDEARRGIVEACARAGTPELGDPVAEEIEDLDVRADALGHLARAWLRGGRPDEARARLDSLEDPRQRAGLLAGLGRDLLRRGDADGAREVWDAAFADLRRVPRAGDPNPTLYLIVLLHALRGDVPAALGALAEITHPDYELLAVRQVVAARTAQGDAEALEVVARSLPSPYYRLQATLGAAMGTLELLRADREGAAAGGEDG